MYDDDINYYGFPRELGAIRLEPLPSGGGVGVSGGGGVGGVGGGGGGGGTTRFVCHCRRRQDARLRPRDRWGRT